MRADGAGVTAYVNCRSNASSSISKNTRVLAGIKRRPGNTAHPVTSGNDHSGLSLIHI